MRQVAAVSVVYRRDGVEPFRIDAVPGQMITELEETNGIALRSTVRDFSISQSQLAANLPADAPRPLKNDEITQTIEGSDHRFIVNADGFSVSHFDESDAFGKSFRIHTVLDEIVK